MHELGGLRVGLDESSFHTFTGYLGDVINDDVVALQVLIVLARFLHLHYGNGWQLLLWKKAAKATLSTIMFRTLLVAVKYAGGCGVRSHVVAYDSVIEEEWAAKFAVT